MSHKPLFLKDVRLSFPHKTCFEDFSTEVPPGSRIGIIGRNGCGKSSLLKLLAQTASPAEGRVVLPVGMRIGYVPQIVEDFDGMSGGERFQKAFTEALSHDPDLLLLDEPTNHLDHKNRTSLIRLLRTYERTLIVASHDRGLLRACIETFWHLDGGKVHVFTGIVDDYFCRLHAKREALHKELSHLNREKKERHLSLMKEQERARKSNLRGEKSIRERKWPTIVSREKARRAIETSGKKKRALVERRQELQEALATLRPPEVIIPKFWIPAAPRSSSPLISIQDGGIGYEKGKPLLTNLHFTLYGGERVALLGENGSGKTTFLKGILGEMGLFREGLWRTPGGEDIGVLDQHYGTLDPLKTVYETIREMSPSEPPEAVRCHLNDFLFRKNEEVYADVSGLSGGEKARLSLARLAARPPKLLLLDEVTNNLDSETRAHVTQVLKEYPGALLLISHDQDFLNEIGKVYFYEIRDGTIHRSSKS